MICVYIATGQGFRVTVRPCSKWAWYILSQSLGLLDDKIQLDVNIYLCYNCGLKEGLYLADKQGIIYKQL